MNAADNAGNPSSLSVTYRVTYGICLLYDPTKAANSGSTIPIKLQLCDANGVNLSSAAITVTSVEVDTAGGVFVRSEPGSFRYDTQIAGYIFNLKTTGLLSGNYKLQFTVAGDPATHGAPFRIK